MNTLTIGMATYKDFEGVWMTIEALRAYHPHAFDLIVIDTAPQSCRQTEGVTKAAGGKYFHRPDLVGTAAPRDQLFRVARSPWVMCLDSHVLLEPNAVAAAIAYAESHPDCIDLIQGPLVHDDGKACSTHWRPTTPPGLWGTWDTDPRHAAAEAFEIPMQGLGLWMMRREAWPGFNPAFRGFGGEEGYIHEKTRQLGGKSLCIPSLRWRHRFRDTSAGAPYPLRLEDHVLNLLVGHRELGVEAEEQIHADFAKKLPPDSWTRLRMLTAAVQPVANIQRRSRPVRLLGIWYSNNAAPVPILKHSLETIRRAAESSRHDVHVASCSWEPITGNPFPWVKADRSAKPGHGQILAQQFQCVGLAGDLDFEAVVFLEHDVIYPPDYFDRIGEALAANPTAPVVSNLDYIGLNGTGWLRVKERHEPLHQLTIRREAFEENFARAEAEVNRQGWANLEPEGDRSSWVRIPPVGTLPAVHINHPSRLTSHGEVVYEASSTLGQSHPFWGDFKRWWPLKTEKGKATSSCNTCGGPPAPPEYPSLEAWYKAAAATPSDFHEHMPTLRSLADRCQSVAEVSLWATKPALLALAASKAEAVTSYCPAVKPEYTQIAKFRGSRFRHVKAANAFEPVDLLFLDTRHNAATLYAELDSYHARVGRYLVVHCTDTFGEKGDDGAVGVMPAVRGFVKSHPEWTAVRHDKGNHGLIVLSKHESDKQQPPGVLRKALNFTKAIAEHAKDGARLVSDEVHASRLELCMLCPNRHHDVCGLCGCPVDKKASWASSECPDKPARWGKES